MMRPNPSNRPTPFLAGTIILLGVVFGDLGPATSASARALRPGGWFVFTVEAALNELYEGFCIQPHGHYSHTAEYVHSLLITAGFQCVRVE
jgi:predicted TPR repeat methyltransferase